ncbi:unnamed protein product [Mycena citricolor]|uniref:CxC1-like cysteine cluster associated with KDZ transposases domain-containing protein n=1 Tax=Mycena citricolor TaxID=2018698 RepID=A0AAD2I0V7_9AGAR|nr:unnamed protein product [Mycena citricolor]
MSYRPRLSGKKKSKPTYDISIDSRRAHYRRRSRQDSLAVLSDGTTLSQLFVPARPGQGGFSVGAHNDEGSQSAQPTSPVDRDDFATQEDCQTNAEPASTRHARMRQDQANAWISKVIPQLRPIFLDLLHRTTQLRNMENAVALSRPCKCGVQRELKVFLLTWHEIEEVTLNTCPCCRATHQLVSRGFFPSSPVEPRLGVDMRLLEFASELSLNMAPNNRAFTKSVESCLDTLGFKLPNRDAIRRQFSNAHEWYNFLRHQVNHQLDHILDAIREDLVAEEKGKTQDKRPATPIVAHLVPPDQTPNPLPRKRGRDIFDSSLPISLTKRSRQTHYPLPTSSAPPSRRLSPARASFPPSSPPASSTAPMTSPARPSALSLPPSSPAASSSGQDDRNGYPFAPPPERDRPSEYLRSRCPACFGGKWEDARLALACILCGDANFTQKRNKDRGRRDPSRSHPESSFVSDDLTAGMAEWVEGIRPHKAASKAAAPEGDDVIEAPDIPLPRSVLNECERSFAAADEARTTVNSAFFDDKGLMGISCRHDNLLFLANIKTPGERQFYMFALLEAIFQHLPRHFVIGFLYDIACQLQRSACKYGFLPPEYMERMQWAVSVLHSYGHGAACQATYHPRRRTLFGYSDGEGLERFWHSLSHLVSYLRVCGYHKRRYTLDAQIVRLHKNNLKKLGSWLARRYLDCADHHRHAQAGLDEILKNRADGGLKIEMELLRSQHKKQVDTLAKPLPPCYAPPCAPACRTYVEMHWGVS